jgi:citronellol/citronellal dehydrogenase
VFTEGLFDGKSIIVTGGGSGIGRCTAHELASLGATVALVGRNPDKLETVKTEISEDGGRAFTFVCDIRDEPSVIATVETVLERTGWAYRRSGEQCRGPVPRCLGYDLHKGI